MENQSQSTAIFNSNRIVSSTEDSWASLREGSFIRFGEDDEHYQISFIRPLSITKKVKFKNRNQIEFNEDLTQDLILGDNIKIYLKKYELLTVKKQLEPGKGYKTGDILALEGGKLYIDPFTGLAEPTLFEVSLIGEEGQIKQLRLMKRGQYLIPPKEETKLRSGFGSGATVEVLFEETADKLTLERTIIRIDNNREFTVVEVDSNVPEGLDEGIVHITKWEGFLTEKYAQKSKFGVPYYLSRDFTPNLKIPFISKITGNPYTVYNLAIKTLDREFGKIKKDIEKIKNRLEIKD